MEQVRLDILQRLPYHAKDFVLHSGVKADYKRCLSMAQTSQPAIVFFHGIRRSGKTHLAMRLEDELQALNCKALLIGPGELAELALTGKIASEAHCLIVDDAHLYLESISAGNSGPFVSFCEALRRENKVLVLLSASDARSFDFDQHVASRINAGAGFLINAPAAEELMQLLQVMAKQRGKKINTRALSALSKRVGRQFSDLEEALAAI